MFYSLFSPEVLVGGTVSGIAFVLLTYLRRGATKHLRWLWLEIREFLLAISPLLGLILICWLIRNESWAKTTYKTMGCLAVVVMAIAYVIVYGANRDRK